VLWKLYVHARTLPFQALTTELQTAVANALPVIVNVLQGTDFAWIGTAYTLAATAFLPLSGAAAEVTSSHCTALVAQNIPKIFGRRPSLVGAIVIFAVGSILCGASKTMAWLIGARSEYFWLS
jgi:MFS family permease